MDALALADRKEEETLAMRTLALLEKKESSEEHESQFISSTSCPDAP